MSKNNIEKLGANTVSLRGYYLYQAIEKIGEMGFMTIGLNAHDCKFRGEICPGFLTEDSADTERLKSHLEKFKHISIHAPFIDVHLITSNKGIREESLKQVRTTIEASALLGGKEVTVHANPKTMYKLDEYWIEMIDTFRKLGDYARTYGIKIGIETQFPDTVKDYLNLIDEIGHKYIGSTLDIGHIYHYIHHDIGSSEGAIEFNDILEEMVFGLRGKIVVMHIHDVKPIDFPDHRNVGKGIIDFHRLFKNLIEIDYSGLMELELGDDGDPYLSLLESQKYLLKVMNETGFIK